MSKVSYREVLAFSLWLSSCSAPASLPDGGPPGGGGQATGSGGQTAAGGNGGGAGSSAGFGTGGSNGGSSGGIAGSSSGSGGAPGAGGTSAGNAGSGTSGSSGASAGSGGQASGPWGNTQCASWPTPVSTQTVSDTIEVNGVYDGGMKRFVGTGDLGDESGEGLPPIFQLSNGETLRNVIIGKPASDGVHCDGSCTLENVWWEDVGEDAATLEGGGNPTMTVDCGGARNADDKVFQHNAGGTIVIRNFTAEYVDKLYRSCGNCSDQSERHAQIQNVTAITANRIAGVNENYGDSVTFTNILTGLGVVVCERYQGCEGCDEPSVTGSGPDSEHCLYQYTEIHYP